MSDGVLDQTGEARLLINLVGIRVSAVRFHQARTTREVRLVRSLGHDVVLVWACESIEQAIAQAEFLWARSIPARVVTDPAEETAFVHGLTGGKEDGV